MICAVWVSESVPGQDCCFAVMMDDKTTAWCPLCGAEFCNIWAFDAHFRIYHEKLFTRKRTVI